MKKFISIKKICCWIGLLFVITGCARLVETAKVIWGSSTRALEEARSEAFSKTFRCSVDECFNSVIKLTQTEAAPETAQTGLTTMLGAEQEKKEEPTTETPKTDTWDKPVKPKVLDLFFSDRKRQMIDLMGVPNSRDTTEVGVFFTAVNDQGVKVEVASLSLSAKKAAAEILFNELALHYEEVK